MGPLRTSDISILVPKAISGILAAAPLAYYLRADIDFTTAPKLVVGDTAYPLGDEYETTLAEILKRVFYCDCVVRTAGLYPVHLDGSEAIRNSFPIDIDELYQLDTASQVQTYLELDADTLEDRAPQWLLTGHVRPTPESVEALPYLLDELAVIRTNTTREVSDTKLKSAAVDLFLRSPSGDSGGETAHPDSILPNNETVVRVEKDASRHHSYVGDGVALNANSFMRPGCLNRQEKHPTDRPLTVAIVYNDVRMVDELQAIQTVYGNRDRIEFDLEVYDPVSKQTLAELLESEIDFLHYIGHATHDGIECTDGYLDVATIDQVNVETFFLNACQSYTQGKLLVQKGAVGGVVTLSKVNSQSATEVGSMLAKLLNQGFTIRSGLDIARSLSITGGQYSTIGDDGVALVQAESGTPYLVEVTDVSETWQTIVETYPTKTLGMGSLFSLQIGPSDTYYLTSDSHGPFALSSQELSHFLSLEDVPLRFAGSVEWSRESDLSELHD
ncbi:hypothetical protein ACH9L7_17005 (plasmid) [Haloferax sp. S1W]|uniref:hypothetical protein n=1 Tax=Haloferax sp. S1W TaxID=3377110 RepID=UPI0037C575BB